MSDKMQDGIESSAPPIRETPKRKDWQSCAARVDDGCFPEPTVIDMEKMNVRKIEEVHHAGEGYSMRSRAAYERNVGNFAPSIALINPMTECLEIRGDTPTNEEWDVLGAHFHNVKKLYVSTGFHECWVDDRFPLNWPLEFLMISDATGELVQTPAILEGLVPHVVLYLTCNLMFEGPSSDQLSKTDEDAMTTFPGKDGATDPGVEIVNRPELVIKWMDDDHSEKTISLFDTVVMEAEKPSRLKKLEILGNDAVDAVQRLLLAKDHLIFGLEHLNLRSAGYNDFYSGTHILIAALAHMPNLKQLELTLEGIEPNEPIVKDLLTCLPPNLEHLWFRGPVGLAKDPVFREWIEVFRVGTLPTSLKSVCVALDMLTRRTLAPVEELRTAKVACEELLGAARARGISVEEPFDHWANIIRIFPQIDGRWASLSTETS